MITQEVNKENLELSTIEKTTEGAAQNDKTEEIGTSTDKIIPEKEKYVYELITCVLNPWAITDILLTFINYIYIYMRFPKSEDWSIKKYRNFNFES